MDRVDAKVYSRESTQARKKTSAVITCRVITREGA